VFLVVKAPIKTSFELETVRSILSDCFWPKGHKMDWFSFR